MTAKLEAIVFDLDGTLIDSAPELALALNSGLSEAGRRRLDVEEVKMMVGDGIDKLVERGLEATGGPVGADEVGAAEGAPSPGRAGDDPLRAR